jgi:hypothetical protein
MSKLIKFNTRSEFDDFVKTNSGLDNLEEALASENNGVYGSVVFIADTGEIYANNKINTPGQGGDSEVPDLDDYALKSELSASVSIRETLMVSSLIADGWSLGNALELIYLPLFDGNKSEGERSTVYKLILSY